MARSSSPKLFTEEEVLSALRREVEFTSLTAVSKKYGLAASQISDVLVGRANLSKRMVEFMSYRMVKLYEKVGKV